MDSRLRSHAQGNDRAPRPGRRHGFASCATPLVLALASMLDISTTFLTVYERGKGAADVSPATRGSRYAGEVY